MTELNKLAYINGNPGTDFQFPYQYPYLGSYSDIMGFHQWKRAQLYHLETFIRKCYNEPVIIQGDDAHIVCINKKQLDFFREQRNIIVGMFRLNGRHVETTTGYFTDGENQKWIVETMSYAGTYRLFAKYKTPA